MNSTSKIKQKPHLFYETLAALFQEHRKVSDSLTALTQLSKNHRAL
jgi:hypothetical protein